MAFFDIFKKKQDNSAAQASEERKQQQEELNAGLEKTKTGLFSKLARAVAGRSTVDADVLDDLEEVLISSDVGVETTVKIIRGIEERVARDKYMGTSELQSILREEVTALMEESHGSEKHFHRQTRGPAHQSRTKGLDRRRRHVPRRRHRPAQGLGRPCGSHDDPSGDGF